MTTMKAVRMHGFGGVEVLHYEDVERPAPHAGELLVRVRAVGVNPLDTASRQHPLPITTGAGELPYTLGWDVSGKVVALGAGATGFAVGDAVYGLPRFPGEAKAYSEYVTAPAANMARKPLSLSYQEAASIPLAGLVAWQALFDVARLRAGQTVLIIGGAGGVGHFAVQFAKGKGARVAATTSTRNIGFVRDLGADVLFDYTQQAHDAMTGDADVVLHTADADALRLAFEAVVHGGMVVSTTPWHRELGEQLAGAHDAAFVLVEVHPSGEQLVEMTALFDAGQARPHLDAVFPLRDAARAHTLSEGGHVRGKLVLTAE